MRIGVVAGEESGDQLGAGLIRALHRVAKEQSGSSSVALEISGLGGRRMLAEGFHSIASMEILSVMGFVEPFKRLPSLLSLRKQLINHFLDGRFDLVIGIDSPDFNLGLERHLRKNGVKTCHYVCPSVWAWRQGRVKKIKASADHVLTLLPFEQRFLERAGIASTFVGHPVADYLSQLESVKQPIESQLEAEQSFRREKSICLMPGSRLSELDKLLEIFLQAAQRCSQHFKACQFEIPAANQTIFDRIQTVLVQDKYRDIRAQTSLTSESAHTVMQRSDIILLASGTASLEAGLLAKPMVVAYCMAPLTHALAKRLVKVDHIALPNLLLEDRVVPEFIQDDVNPRCLADKLISILENPDQTELMVSKLGQLMPMLAKDADLKAAQTVLGLMRH